MDHGPHEPAEVSPMLTVVAVQVRLEKSVQ